MEIILLAVLTINLQTPINEALDVNDNGVCKKTNNDGTVWLSCCAGFIQNKDRCEDCPNGTFGDDCKSKCHPNFYGHKCLSLCNCKANETCDRIVGCTESTTSGNKNDYDDSDTSSPSAIVLISVVVPLLVLGIILCVYAKKRNMHHIKLPCLPKNRLFVQSRPKENRIQQDNEDIYSEIRESLMVRPMTVYGRQLSIFDISCINPLEEYHHLSIKSFKRRSQERKCVQVDHASSSEYVDPIDVSADEGKQLTKTPNGEHSGAKTTHESCEYASVAKRNQKVVNNGFLMCKESPEVITKEVTIIACDANDDIDPYSYARHSGHGECEHKEDKSNENLKEEMEYSQVVKVNGLEYTDIPVLEVHEYTGISLADVDDDHEYKDIQSVEVHVYTDLKSSELGELATMSKNEVHGYTEIDKEHEYTEISDEETYTEKVEISG